MTSIFVTVILFKLFPMRFTFMMTRFLSPLLSAQFMTPIRVHLELDFFLVFFLDIILSESLPAVGYAFSPAVGPPFPTVVALFHPLWVRSFHLSGVIVGAVVISCLFSTVRSCPPHHLRNVRSWLRQKLGCPHSDPRVHHHTWNASLNLSARSFTCHTLSGDPAPLRGSLFALQALCVETHDPKVRLATRRGFRRATCGPLLRVAGNASSWSFCFEGLCRERRSAPLIRLCSARLPAIVHSSARDRRVTARPPGCSPPKLCLRVRTTLIPAAVPATYGCVPRCQWAPRQRCSN